MKSIARLVQCRPNLGPEGLQHTQPPILTDKHFSHGRLETARPRLNHQQRQIDPRLQNHELRKQNRASLQAQIVLFGLPNLDLCIW
ncbi:hypothetical protein ACWGS9_33015 [Bradyrhizobium sp. Arg314]